MEYNQGLAPSGERQKPSENEEIWWNSISVSPDCESNVFKIPCDVSATGKPLAGASVIPKGASMPAAKATPLRVWLTACPGLRLVTKTGLLTITQLGRAVDFSG
jgi:hypothetical protein